MGSPYSTFGCPVHMLTPLLLGGLQPHFQQILHLQRRIACRVRIHHQHHRILDQRRPTLARDQEMDPSNRPPREQTSPATAIRPHTAKGGQPQQAGTRREGRESSWSKNGQPGCDDEGQGHQRKGLIRALSRFAGNGLGVVALDEGHGVGAFCGFAGNRRERAVLLSLSFGVALLLELTTCERV